ncbi:MAG TPA: tetratricopeptide repeat protein [Negativicutes bacterium]|nr:tetratricopeptide repeat protein [Negativicutes bacterium]
MPKKPVPIWAMILLPVLIALIVLCVFTLPEAVRGRIASEQGRRALDSGRYSTAIKKYEQAMERFPDSGTIAAGLAVSYFQNEQMDKCRKVLDLIEGKKLPAKLCSQVNEIIGLLDSTYHESDELAEILDKYGQEELESTAAKLEAYLAGNGTDVMGIFQLANVNFDMGKYSEAEKLYIKAAGLAPGFYSAQLNLAAVYRITGRYSESGECCHKVLAMNKEHPQAYVALSKLFLEQGSYKEALSLAMKAYEYDEGDLQVLSNLCIAYHFNGMTAERDRLLDTLKQKDYYDMPSLQSILANNSHNK